MPLLNIESLNKIIVIPDLADESLKTVIYKIKVDQMLALANDVYGSLYGMDDNDPETLRYLLRIILMEDIDDEALLKIFQIIPSLDQDDENLRESVKQLQDKSVYSFLYTFRHKFFLNKPTVVKDNAKAYLERRSDKYLARGHSHISVYLRQSTLSKIKALSDDEIKLLLKTFPEQKLANRYYRRDAHQLIALSTLEMQSLLVNFISQISFGETITIPDDNVQLSPLHGKSLQIYMAYTNQAIFDRMFNNFDGFQQDIWDKKYSPNTIDYSTGNSLLISAVMKKHESAVLFLLEEGAKADIQNQEGCCALHYAAENLQQGKIFQAILDQTTQIDTKDRGKYTPLYIAAEFGHAQYCQALLERGANPNHNDNRFKNSVLHIAVRNKEKEVVDVLLRSNKPDIGLLDNRSLTPLILAQRLGLLDIVAAIQKYSKSLPAAQRSITLRELAVYLQGAKQCKSFLKSVRSAITFDEPLNSVSRQPVITKPDYRQFNVLFTQESQNIIRARQLMSEIASEIKSLMLNGELSAGQKYYRIIAIVKRVIDLNLNSSDFALELYKNDGLDYLIYLQDEKSSMQVAIELEDIAAIREILQAEPIRKDKTIIFQGRQCSELRYTIELGKSNVFNFLNQIAQENPAVDLGSVSKEDELFLLAREKEQELVNANAAFQELYQYYEFSAPTASSDNWQRLIRSLIITAPINHSELNGLFADEEYLIVQKIVAEQQRRPFSKIVYDKLRAIVLLRARLEQIEKGDPCTYPSELVKTQNALSRTSKRLYSALITKDQMYRSPPVVSIRKVFRHATCNLKAIQEHGELTTVQTALDLGKITTSSTPEGALNNSYFSVDKAYLTPLRTRTNADSHVISVYVYQAIKQGLFALSEVYTSPHLPAYKVQRIDQPIIFIGNDPTLKTIYRVFHVVIDNKFAKIHQYDYYINDQLHSSHKEVYRLEEEFFVGDNIVSGAYRLIYHLRRIKGPFEKGSYTHYVVDNILNIGVIEAAMAALFSVYNTEGKISKKGFSINHEAVVVNVNDESYAPMGNDVIAHLNTFIIDGNLESFKENVQNFSLKKEQLSPFILTVIQHANLDILDYLLELGVNWYQMTENPLYYALTSLRYHYYKKKQGDSENQFDIRMSVVNRLLFVGAADPHDPHHISYGACIDALIKKSAWANYDPNNVNLIFTFLCSFHDEATLGQWIIDSTNRDVERLASLCLEYGQLQTAQNLHKKMGLELSLTPMMSRAFALVDEENISELDQIMPSVSIVSILSYAICKKNNLIANKLFESGHGNIIASIQQLLMLLTVHGLDAVILSILPLLMQMDVIELAYNYAIIYRQEIIIKLLSKYVVHYDMFIKNQTTFNDLVILTWMLESIPEEYFFKKIGQSTKKLVCEIIFEKGSEKAVDIFMQIVSTRMHNNIDVIHLTQALLCMSVNLKENQFQLALKNIIALKPADLSKQLAVQFSRFAKYASRANLRLMIEELALLDSSLITCPIQVAAFLVAIEHNRVDNIKEIRSHYPLSNLFTSQSALDLLVKGVKFCKDNSDLLDEIIELTKLKIDVKIALLLLTVAFNGGHLTAIKWLYKQQYLQPNVCTDYGYCFFAILQMYQDPNLFERYIQVRGEHKNHIDSFNLLCDTIGENPNLVYMDKLLLFQADRPNFQLLMLQSARADLAVKDRKGQSFLHSIVQSLVIEHLEQYIAAGGNIQEENARGETLLEHIIRKQGWLKPVPQKFPDWVAVLTQAGCRLRDIITPPIHSKKVIFCSYQTSRYILVHGNHILHDNSDAKNRGDLLRIKSHDSFDKVCEFYYQNLGEQKSLADINLDQVIVPEVIKEAKWVKVPSTFSKNIAGDYFASNGEQHFYVTITLRILLEGLGNKNVQQILSPDQYQQLRSAYIEDYEKLLEIYKATYQNNFQQLIVNHRSYMIQLRSQNMTFNAAFLKEIYQEGGWSSPLELALRLDNQDMIKYWSKNNMENVVATVVPMSEPSSTSNSSSYTVPAAMFRRKRLLENTEEANVEEHSVGRASSVRRKK